jgi:formate-dependent nitrite reductase membrane component NrfD
MSSSSAYELLAQFDESLPEFDESLAPAVRGIAFWTAIALPFLYLPLLITGLNSGATRIAFVVLVVFNAVTLLIGHAHRGDD